MIETLKRYPKKCSRTLEGSKYFVTRYWHRVPLRIYINSTTSIAGYSLRENTLKDDSNCLIKLKKKKQQDFRFTFFNDLCLLKSWKLSNPTRTWTRAGEIIRKPVFIFIRRTMINPTFLYETFSHSRTNVTRSL